MLGNLQFLARTTKAITEDYIFFLTSLSVLKITLLSEIPFDYELWAVVLCSERGYVNSIKIHRPISVVPKRDRTTPRKLVDYDRLKENRVMFMMTGKVCDRQLWCIKMMRKKFRKNKEFTVLSLFTELVLRGQK